MTNRILLKRDDTPGKIPLVGDLDFGELAVNTYDGKMYTKRIDLVGGSPLGSPIPEEIVVIGDPKGKVVDSIEGLITPQTGTTSIPFDNTVPLITEGTQIGAGIVTIAKIDNHVEITFSMTLESSSPNKTIILAVFRGSVCIGAIPISMGTNNAPIPFTWTIHDDPGAVGAITYSGRIGISGGTWAVNTSSSGTLGGAIAAASIFGITVKTSR